MSFSPRILAPAALIVALLALIAIFVIGGKGDSETTRAAAPEGSVQASPDAGRPSAPEPPAPIRIAFAGDIMTEGSAGRILSEGLGSAGRVLRRADLAVVNVETAIAADRTGLEGEPKEFTFISSPQLLRVLRRSGVDAASMANNHGMDYGREGLARTLKAGRGKRPVIIGVGSNIEQALKPYRTRVRGRGVTIFAGSDVLDEGFDWAATETESGVAIIKSMPQLAALRNAVVATRKARPDDVVAVFLHGGKELEVCPTERQQYVAEQPASAGADAVLMSHAHILQPSATIGKTAVVYGLGNFVFYAESAPTNITGIMQITFPPAGSTPRMRFKPAVISGGLPQMLSGQARRDAVSAYKALGSEC